MSPLAMFPRQVAKPVRLADTTLEPGARLGLLVASANRDERHWEDPDRFDVHRPKQRTVAFGVGHHFCLGVWMARHQIGGAALPALFERLDALAARSRQSAGDPRLGVPRTYSPARDLVAVA